MLQRFLSSESLKSVVVQAKGDSVAVGECQFSRQVDFGQSVVLSKRVEVVSAQNYKEEVIVSSGSSNNMLRNLQEMIEKVFMQQKGLDYNIIQQLQSLESNIDLAFKKNPEDEADLNSIMSVDDEQQYWAARSDQSPRSKYF